jgi:hypothetical protein
VSPKVERLSPDYTASHPTLPKWYKGPFSQGVRRPGQSPPANEEIKNVWNDSSTAHPSP